MPRSAMRFVSTLRVATFSFCEFPEDAAQQLQFPNLQHLELTSVTISEDSLHAMVAGYPALDKFVLGYIRGSSLGPQVPLSALHSLSNIRIAKFQGCQFPEGIVHQHQVHFPNLQSLELALVTISEGSLHAMLSVCPALNNLKLVYSTGFRQFKTNALKLKYVEMYFSDSDADKLQELIVENAPCLETLHHEGPREDNMHITIITAPKLKILGRLTDTNISRLELGTTVFKVCTTFLFLSFITYGLYIPFLLSH